jgi:hypothetical protein
MIVKIQILAIFAPIYLLLKILHDHIKLYVTGGMKMVSAEVEFDLCCESSFEG